MGVALRSLTPLSDLPVTCVDREENLARLRSHILAQSAGDQPLPVYVVCRRGNDSQVAVQKLKNHFKSDSIQFKDITGGLHAWAKHIDTNFPVYWLIKKREKIFLKCLLFLFHNTHKKWWNINSEQFTDSHNKQGFTGLDSQNRIDGCLKMRWVWGAHHTVLRSACLDEGFLKGLTHQREKNLKKKMSQEY